MDIIYRKLPVDIESGKPRTFNAETRTMRAIAATDSGVNVASYERGGIIKQVLIMSGLELPANGQVPFLDSHNRFETSAVIGSFRNIDVKEHIVEGEIHFSSTSDDVMTKYGEGDLTDTSVGYTILEKAWVPEKESMNFDGRKFKGPVEVVTRWKLHELSAVPIGADDKAKARADVQQPENIKKEKDIMNDEFKKILMKSGLPESATDDEAIRFMEKMQIRADKPDEKPEDEKPEKDEKPEGMTEHERMMIINSERERTIGIETLCRHHGFDDLKTELIQNGASMDAARKAILDKLSERNVDVSSHPATIMADGVDKFRSAAEDAVLIRMGASVEKPVAGATDLTGFSMVEMARKMLKTQNLDDRGNSLILMGRALTTSDFPYLLSNVANKVLFDGFSDAPTTWQEWCSTGSVSDFKTYNMPRVSEADDVDEIPEGMQYKYGTFTENNEQYSIKTYGKMEAITRQMLINDDLNAVSVMLRKRGRALARKLNALAYAVLTGNAAMGDGTALFHADHGNLATSAGLPGVATMNAMELAMMKQQDLKSLQYLNIMPEVIIMPAALKGASEIFFRTERYADSDTVATDSSLAATRTNTWSGDRVRRVYDPVLDADSATAWYVTGPKEDGVKMFFLNGNQTPYMESQAGWTVDGMEYKARIDAYPKALTWENLYKNAGA